ncbi:MAG: hypothetical protein F6K00_13725 [Leptolyngbya sp. SIOISBB]|nr:hypothetical protein [Leptolyngbya sp. SIOISBB]
MAESELRLGDRSNIQAHSAEWPGSPLSDTGSVWNKRLVEELLQKDGGNGT